MKCSICNGTGHDITGSITTSCKMCKGTGDVDVVMHIESLRYRVKELEADMAAIESIERSTKGIK